MRIVATSDTHFPFSEDKIPSGDVFIHAGDLMYTGLPDEWYKRVDSLAALDHKHKIYVPGNHDFHLQNYEGLARAELRKAGVKTVGTHPDFAVHKLPNGMLMLGVPFVTGLNGWAFCRHEEWVYDYLMNLNVSPDIVVSHAPMYGVLDAIRPEKFDFREQEHVGGMGMNRWFDQLKRKPKVWITGHIHESYGRSEYDGCIFYNVAMCDRNYNQNNKPMVIDLED